jgi:divalent metal cation (Fe/Co/Zn/Cd) transporter
VFRLKIVTACKRGSKRETCRMKSLNITEFLDSTLMGILSGSIALIADAIHSFTDVISSIGVFIGLKISSRKPTKEFPYGFYKTEI